MAITQTQIASSYNFTVEYTDGLAQLLKIVVENSILEQVYEKTDAVSDTTYTIPVDGADTYTVYYYTWDGTNWVLDDQQSITILEYQLDIDWYYMVGDNYVIEPATSYDYLPDTFILNNNVCQVPPLPSEINYQLYELIDGVWTAGDSLTIDLIDVGWDDEAPDYDLIKFPYQTNGYPIKIVTTVSNCNGTEVHDTYVDDEFLITSTDATNINSAVQTPASYNIIFNYSFGNENGDHPNLVITPENSSYTQCNLYIYKNDVLIHTYEKLSPTQFYSYTLAEASVGGNNGISYFARYISINNNTGEQYTQDIPFTVNEYKPTFTLPTIQCYKINESASITLASLRFNCFADEESFHYLPGDYTPNINYKLYYLNPNTYLWELQVPSGLDPSTYSGVNTPDLADDADDYLTANPNADDTAVSNFLKNKYYFGSVDTTLWTPNKLTMVKLVVTVSNYSTSVTKETIFPICGTWKIRRMSCGKYRIYNYTPNDITFTIKKSDGQTFTNINTIQVPPFSFVTFDLPDDGIYEVEGALLSKYIFNFCEVENCILELQKRVLLDDTLCDACRLDKVLYQKALRIIPIYETWKKLLDRDWVYEIQYQSTDPDKNLTAIYDAYELYLELKDLCASCEYDSDKCKCK
jgi:hypothetical protein